MACIFPRSPGLGRGGVALAALDLGILLVLPPKEFRNAVRLVSRASLDCFRSFAFEWFQGWFSILLNDRFLWDQLKLFIVPSHRSL